MLVEVEHEYVEQDFKEKEIKKNSFTKDKITMMTTTMMIENVIQRKIESIVKGNKMIRNAKFRKKIKLLKSIEIRMIRRRRQEARKKV